MWTWTACLETEAATLRLAATLASALDTGDVVLLAGPVGAGKSTFARAAIRWLQAAAGQQPEEVPSPSYTLVQSYAAGGREIWHVDLYRLVDVSELTELGLEDAFDSAICLVEWPELLVHAAPRRALQVRLDPDPDLPERRHVRIAAVGGAWASARRALLMLGTGSFHGHAE